jgi:hypothetical protein
MILPPSNRCFSRHPIHSSSRGLNPSKKVTWEAYWGTTSIMSHFAALYYGTLRIDPNYAEQKVAGLSPDVAENLRAGDHRVGIRWPSFSWSRLSNVARWGANIRWMAGCNRHSDAHSPTSANQQMKRAADRACSSARIDGRQTIVWGTPTACTIGQKSSR